jgi:hypothetical protein
VSAKEIQHNNHLKDNQMKKIILLTFACVLVSNLWAQVYKLEPIFEGSGDDTFLSHKKVLESKDSMPADSMILWGYHLYASNAQSNAYEVKYFNGTAKETYSFLKQLIDFTEKYSKEDQVVTFIHGVKVKTVKQTILRHVLSVYDTEQKVACDYTLTQWKSILSKFVDYCDKHKIIYQ